MPCKTDRRFRLLLPVLILLVAAATASGQRTRIDPDLPPPPNFTPGPVPEPPPGPPPSGLPGSQQASAPASAPAEIITPAVLVEEGDPRMREPVGMIRIPDMGTNEVVEMLEAFTEKPILRQQNLPAVKITFFSQGPLSRGEAIRAIESLLSLNGIAITPLGDAFLKAVPAAIINAQGAPIWEGSTIGAIPSQKIYEKLFSLEFLSAQEAVPMIQPLMSQGAPIAFDKSHLMLVTDALVNLQRIERIIELIDTPARLRSIMVFFELQNVAAQEALRRLQQLQTGPLRRQLENNTAFDADDRTNQLIIFTHPSNVPLLTELVERLDIDAAPLTTTRVINIRYADAEELVGIIEQIVTGQKQVRDQAAAGSQSSRSAQQAAAAAAAARRVQTQNQTATTARAEATNLQFSDFLTIVADKRANTVVASGTPNDLRYLEELIKEIDTLLAQVRIEVVITEVRLDDSDTRGIDSFGFRYNITAGSGGAITVPGSSQKYAFPGDFYGATIDGVTWGPDGFGIQAVLNAARTNSNVSVLSAPTIVTTHNKEATVSVGEERPVLVGQTTSGVSNFVTDNIQFKDIKLELKVLPLIGSDGVIQLEINQTIQSVLGEIKIGNDFRPIVGTRAANSYVSVKDGELIVLGGLQKADISATHSRMAILGKLPIIGDLFSRKTDRNVRNELLIFIRPTIIRDTDAAHRDANQMIDTIEGTENIRSYLEEGTFRNVGQPPPKEADSATPPRRRNQP